jgi:membrane associated rhomboid family serine protease
MIPLRDINPRFSTPFMTVGIILGNVAVWLYQISLPAPAEERFVFALGMVPARLQVALGSPEVSLTAAVFPLISSIFLHGSWMHIIGNMWFLWVFGDNIEDRLGHIKYLLFYIATGIGAGIVHTAFNWGAIVPAVGASGAISGVMGAYFCYFPRSKIVTLVPLPIFFILKLPAVLILGYWLVIQFLSGVSDMGNASGGGVAWWAHVGGFVLGYVLARSIRQRRRSTSYYME